MKHIVVLGLGAMMATSASAATITFFGEDQGLGEFTPLPAAARVNSTAARNAFFSNLVGVGTEDFETRAGGAPLAVSFGAAGTATLLGTGSVAVVTPGTTNGVGRYATSGSRYWETGSSFSLTFSQPIAAFGFFGIDIGDFNGQVTLALSGGGVENLVVPNTQQGPGGSVLYFGFIRTEGDVSSITFGNTAPGVDFFGFDDFSIGTLEQVSLIPLPSAGAMGLAGLMIVGARRRRDA